MQKLYLLCTVLLMCLTVQSQIIATPAAVCPGKNVELSVPSQTTGSTYQWQSAATSGGPFINIPGATAATYTTNVPQWYQLTVEPGNIVIGPKQIVASVLPVPSFTYSPSGSCSNIPVVFTNTSSPGTYEWHFGNTASDTNNVSHDTNPSHIFVTTGGTGTETFPVTLIVTNAGGCKDSITQNVTVAQLPDVRLGGNGAGTYLGQDYFKACGANSFNFTFTNLSSTAATNTNYQIIWGDGTPDFNSTTFATAIQHSYATGTHTLLYIIDGPNGCRDTGNYTIFVGTNPAVGLNNPGNTTVCSSTTTLVFPISGTSTNSPGTTYTLTFNDGTPAQTFSHPPPASVTHLFLNSSCGTTSGSYPNAFSATLQASNPCASSSAIVVPIYVSKKMPPTFDIGPADTICVGVPASFTNTTLFTVDNTNGVCTPGKTVWTITPSTGWTLASGTMGNSNGSGDVSLWLSGSTTINVNFNLPGTYSIKMLEGNAVCGNDSLIRTICVNPKPVADFTVDNLTGCAPLTVHTTNISNTPLCGNNLYQWTVTYTAAPGCVPSIAAYSYLNGTSATSAAPEFQFDNPGMYTLSLVTTSSAGLCTSVGTVKTITVKSKPIVTLGTLPAAICANTSISPSAASVCFIDANTTYAWSFPGGTPASSTNANPGTIIYNTPGTYAVSLSVTNDCGTTTATTSVLVKEVPQVTLPAAITVCAGTTIGPLNFTSSMTGSTFSWTNSNTGIGLGASGNSAVIPAFTATNATGSQITATINVTVTNNGCSSSGSFVIKVDPRPAAPIVTTPVTYCANAAAVPLTATASAGNTLLWYTTSAGGAGSTTAPTPATGTPGTTIYYVSQASTATTCEGPRAAITVTVKPVPVITATGVDPLGCSAATGSIVINGLTTGSSYIVSYIKNGGAPVVQTLTAVAPGRITITGLGAGTYTNIFVTLNGCPSNTEGPIELTDPTPPAATTAGNNGPICSGTQLQLTAATVTGATYSWTGPNGFTSTQQNPTINNATVAAAGTYSVTVTVAGCSSPAATTTAVINQTPAVPVVTSNSPLCAGSDLTLTSTGTGVTFLWTGPNGFTSTDQNPIITAATTAASGVYTVVVSTATCSNTAAVSVIVRPTPAITVTKTDPTSCGSATGSITIAGLTTGSSYTVSYVKNGGAATVQTLTATAPGNIIINGLTQGTYTNIVVTLNGCPSNIAGPLTLTDPNPPAATTAGNNGPICSGTQLQLSAATVTGATYSWMGPNGFTSTQQNPTINNATVAAAGTYSVTVTVAACTSPAATTTVVINPTPAIPVVTGNSPLCAGNDLTLTASGTGVTFLWTGPNGFTSTDQNPIITAATTAAAGVYTVVVSTATCSNTAAVSVIVRPTPVITVSKSDPTSCGSATGSITISGLTTGSSYTVSYVKNGAAATVQTLAATAPGNIIINGLTQGTYTNIFVTLNGCPSNIAGPLTLTDPNPPAATTAGNNGPICSGTQLQLTAATVAGATYSWTGPNGFTSTQQNPVINNAASSAAGIYSVTVTVAACTSPAATTTVVIDPTPTVPITGSNSPVCAGQNLQLTASSGSAMGNSIVTAVITYSWTGPNGFTSTAQNPLITGATTLASGVYTVTATLGNCSSTATVTVLVKPTPVITVAKTDPVSCGSATGSITIFGLTTGTAYVVSYIKDGGPATVQTLVATAPGNIIINGLTQGTYTNIIATLNGCPSNTAGPLTLTDPNPPAATTAGNNGPICSGTQLQLTAATIAGAAYNWTGPNGFTSTLQNPFINNATIAAAGTYSVTVTVAACTSPAATTAVVVNPTPAVPAAGSNTPVCAGNNLTLTATGTGVTFLWTGPNGFTSTDQNPVITAATTAASGVYTLVTSTATCSSTATVSVTVKPTPVLSPATLVQPTSCGSSTGAIELTGLNAGAAYTVSYVKNGGAPVVVNLTANGTGTVTISNLAAGSYSNIFVILNGCPSNAVGPYVIADPAPPAAPVAVSNTPVCAGSTLTFHATTVSAGAATYAWSGPNGFTSALQSPQILNATAAASGTYSVTATINNCTSPAGTVTAIVNPLPAAPAATSPIIYCKDAPAVPLTAVLSSPGSTLHWYTNATGGQPLSSAPTPATSAPGTTTYYVSEYSAQGCEGQRTPVTVKINADASAIFTPAVTIGCPAFQITNAIIGLQQYPQLNSSYNWYANNVYIGSGTTFPGYTINNENDSVKITLIAVSAEGCKNDTMSKKFYTYKLPHPSFTKDIAQGCGPLTVQFTNTTPFANDFTYTWEFGDGQTSSLQQPGPITFAPSATFNDTFYVVKLKIVTQCETVVYKDSVLVKSKPKAIFSPNNVNGCSPMRVNFTNTSLGTGNTYHWDFDDGQTFTTTSAATFEHIFIAGVIDTFHVKLVVTNSCGSDSLSYLIIAQPNNINLNLSMNGTAQYGCAPHALAFYNNSPGGGSFQWNFGDGTATTTFNTVDTLYHTYNLPGTYTVTLTGFNNCTDTTGTLTVTVYPKPVAAFTADHYTACIGEQINFTNGSSGSNSGQWSFGDGTFSAASNPVHAYTAAGTYDVKLIAYNANPSGNVCSDSIVRQVVIVASLPGNTTVSATTSPCAPFTVSFDNLDLPATSVTWDFGDGQTGTGDHVTHTYTAPGIYQVHVTTLSTGGCTFLSDKTVTVGGPAGSLQYAAGYACMPAPVLLQAAGSGTNTYYWEFGDGTNQTTTAGSVLHQYLNPGAYVPSVTLQSSGGCSSLLRGLDTVKVDRITGGFLSSQTQSCGFTTVNFTDTSHAFFGKASVVWKFGDNQTGSGSIVSHTYAAAGNYNIEMIVTGNSGCTDTTRRTITVAIKSAPVAVISGPTEKCGLENVTFTANINSIDPITIKDWRLSNGATGTGNSFTYNFTLPGTYTLRLIAGSANSCYDTTYHTILIKPVPNVTAGADLTLCKGASSPISVSGNALSYQWGPMEGLSCAACTNPVASPLITTPYVVTGINAEGCAARDTVVVTIIQPMELNVSANDSICAGQTVQLQASGADTYTWSPAATLSSSTAGNPEANPLTTTIYRVIGYDGHNCFTDTGFVKVTVMQKPIVNLGPDLVLSAGTQQPLTTVVQNGPIAQWLWTPSQNLSCNTCPLPVADIKKDITYIVHATTSYGCTASDSISIKVFCTDAQVFIPNAFSPDNDGINDVLMIRGKGIVTVKHFRIFNRWGEVIFEKNNFPANSTAYAWDGKVKGKPSAPDVFVYTAEVMCENGSTFTYKGNISLIK